MKKILSGVLCFMLVLVLTGCANKKKIDGEKFKEIMGEKKFTVVETGNNEDNSDIAYIAQDENGRYQIEFYTLSSIDNAKSKFKSYKDAINNENTSNRKTNNISTSKYEKYTLETSKIYYVISRIEDTMIFLTVDPEYKSEVNKIIKELGY